MLCHCSIIFEGPLAPAARENLSRRLQRIFVARLPTHFAVILSRIFAHLQGDAFIVRRDSAIGVRVLRLDMPLESLLLLEDP